MTLMQVRTRLGFLRERLVDHVVAVLDGAAAGNASAAPTGHWRAVFDKVCASLALLSVSPAVRYCRDDFAHKVQTGQKHKLAVNQLNVSD